MQPLVQYIYTPATHAYVELNGTRGMGKVMGKRVGVLVAYTDLSAPGKYLLGLSLCKRGSTDVFSKAEGTALAMTKAIAWVTRGRLPKHFMTAMRRKWLLAEVRKFQARCDKYFKGLKCVWEF